MSLSLMPYHLIEPWLTDKPTIQFLALLVMLDDDFSVLTHRSRSILDLVSKGLLQSIPQQISWQSQNVPKKMIFAEN